MVRQGWVCTNYVKIVQINQNKREYLPVKVMVHIRKKFVKKAVFFLHLMKAINTILQQTRPIHSFFTYVMNLDCFRQAGDNKIWLKVRRVLTDSTESKFGKKNTVSIRSKVCSSSKVKRTNWSKKMWYEILDVVEFWSDLSKEGLRRALEMWGARVVMPRTTV